jgi:hypothetical protein
MVVLMHIKMPFRYAWVKPAGFGLQSRRFDLQALALILTTSPLNAKKNEAGQMARLAAPLFLKCRAFLKCYRELLNRQDFAETQVKAVQSRGSIIDRDTCACPGRRTFEHLDPIGVAGRRQVLMQDTLVGGRSSSDGGVIVIADGQDQRVISGGDQTRARSTGEGVAGARGTNGA